MNSDEDEETSDVTDIEEEDEETCNVKTWGRYEEEMNQDLGTASFDDFVQFL